MKYVLLGSCHGRRYVFGRDGSWSSDTRDAHEYDTAREVRDALRADQGYADGYDTKENAAELLNP